MTMITVYTTPNCVQCNQTKRYFDSKGVSYETVDLTQDPQAMEMVKSMGYTSAPVVVAGEDSWSGFRLPKLVETVERYSLDKASH